MKFKIKLPKPQIHKIEKSEYKKFFGLALFLLSASIVLITLFIYKNFTYIKNPELSPGYSLGTPFGDGHADFEELGHFVPKALLFFLVLWNFLFCIANIITKRKILMIIACVPIVFFALTFLEKNFYAILNSSCNNSLRSVIFFISKIIDILKTPFVFLYLDMFIISIISPLLIIPLIYFIIKKRRKAIFHTLFSFVSLFAWFTFEMFSVFLYLD